MRRWTLLLAGAGLWLFLAAIPALADGGPHVAANNSGVSTLTADGCAGCHRAHTAQGPLLLAAPDEEALCLSCHGATGTGATTDVESGVQYSPAATTSLRTTTLLGALRSGGFIEARIEATSPIRKAYASGSSVRELGKVPVGASEPVTSSHLAFAAGITATHKAWGNGALATPGTFATVNLSCATCHNPHGNGQYRILNPQPGADGTGPFVEAPAVAVTDSSIDPDNNPANGIENPTKNYTIIQKLGTPDYIDTDAGATYSWAANPAYDASTFLLYARQVAGAYADTSGDYLHRRVPWNATATGASMNDAPNGRPQEFDAQMNAWCASCHTRYSTSTPTFTQTASSPFNNSAVAYATGGSFDNDSGDTVYKYRHSTTSNKPCTTCHVSHGTNAVMTGTFSNTFPYPDGSTAPSSRLLKADNRGTCQLCHDPTGTITAGTLLPPGATETVP